MALVDFEEIRLSMLESDYDSICQQDDSVCTRSIATARAFVQSVIKRFGLAYDEDDISIREALKKRSISEMYIYAAEWDTAEKYKNECSEILKPLAPVRSVTSSISKGSSDWKGYK